MADSAAGCEPIPCHCPTEQEKDERKQHSSSGSRSCSSPRARAAKIAVFVLALGAVTAAMARAGSPSNNNRPLVDSLTVSLQQRRNRARRRKSAIQNIGQRNPRRIEEEDEDNEGEEDEDRDDEDDGEESNEEDDEEDEEEDEEDSNEEEEEEEQDSNEEEEQEDDMEQQQQQPGEDDFFEEDLADDYIRDNNIDDDFYLFIDSPEPPRLLPLTEREIVGYFIASTALTLGASGGIGGGGIVVPVYLLVMGMGPKVAIPIGAVTVLGGALSSTIINTQRRHPLADRPIIDWDFVLVMQPVVLIGVLFGTFIHQLLSEQILIVLLVVLLSVTAHSTLSKAMRMYEAEKRYIRHLKAAQAEPPTGSPSRTFTWGDGELHTMKPQPIVDDEEKERILIENPDFVTLRSDLLEEEKFTPNSKIIVLVSVISVLITLNVMVGGGGMKSPWGITCGSPAFWAIHAIMIIFLMLAAWAAQAYLIARHEIKNIVRFDYVHGDIRWNRRAGWLYPIVFMMAGLLAGMFGIGGGIVIVPLLLAIGTHPAVASSTSSAMVLITSLVSTSTYAVFGLILWDFAVVGFCVAFFSSLVGQILMGRLRQARSASGRTFERNSYIAFVIGGVVLISAVLMTIQYIFSLVKGPDEDYGSLCDGLTFNT